MFFGKYNYRRNNVFYTAIKKKKAAINAAFPMKIYFLSTFKKY